MATSPRAAYGVKASQKLLHCETSSESCLSMDDGVGCSTEDTTDWKTGKEGSVLYLIYCGQYHPVNTSHVASALPEQAVHESRRFDTDGIAYTRNQFLQYS